MWLRSGSEAARGTQGVSVTVWARRGLSDVEGFKVPATTLRGASAAADKASGSECGASREKEGKRQEGRQITYCKRNEAFQSRGGSEGRRQGMTGWVGSARRAGELVWQARVAEQESARATSHTTGKRARKSDATARACPCSCPLSNRKLTPAIVTELPPSRAAHLARRHRQRLRFPPSAPWLQAFEPLRSLVRQLFVPTRIANDAPAPEIGINTSCALWHYPHFRRQLSTPPPSHWI